LLRKPGSRELEIYQRKTELMRNGNSKSFKVFAVSEKAIIRYDTIAEFMLTRKLSIQLLAHVARKKETKTNKQTQVPL